MYAEKVVKRVKCDGDNEGSSGSLNGCNTTSNEKSDTYLFVPKYVIRPIASISATTTPIRSSDNTVKSYLLLGDIWIQIFSYLRRSDLKQCMCVCKTWYKWCLDRSLWRHLDVSSCTLRQFHLLGIVYRQPAILDLSWTNISRQHLEWLVARQPYLKSLTLTGCSWAAVSALCSSICPLLQQLSLNWVDGIADNCIEDLVLPPIDHRPGIDDSLSRLHRCTILDLEGANITDAAIVTIVRHLTRLRSLNVASCIKLSNACVNTLVTSEVKSTLASLNMSGCHGLTDASFTSFLLLTALCFLDLSLSDQITAEACQQFVSRTAEKFKLIGEKQFTLK
jgi:F-box/leucine-rich repeat protein 10/11